MIYIAWTFLGIAIQGDLFWGFSCSCIKMPRKRSQTGLQIPDCLILVASICSLFWCTLPKLSGSKQHVSSPSLQGSGSGHDWAGCQVSDGAAISPAGSAGGGSICFPLRCVAAGRPQFLMGRWMEGLRFFLWASTGSSQHGSFLHQKGTVRRAGGRGKRERDTERGRERGREGRREGEIERDRNRERGVGGGEES